MEKNDSKNTEKSKKPKKTTANPNNKKHLNNKTLKARYILEKNKLAEIREHEGSGAATARKVFRIIRNVVFGVLIAFLAVMIVAFIIVRSNGGTPTVFGYSMQRISSGSMAPDLMVGDIIISKEVKAPSDIAVGDIVTFNGGAYFENKSVTHRVIVAPAENSGGEMVLTTKGDANEIKDPEISFDSVKSKYLSKVEFLSKFYNFFLSPWGLIIFIAALLIVFFDELITLIKVITGAYVYEDEDEETGLNADRLTERLKSEGPDSLSSEEMDFLIKEVNRKKLSKKRNNTSRKKMKQLSGKKSSAKKKEDPKSTSGASGKNQKKKNK